MLKFWFSLDELRLHQHLGIHDRFRFCFVNNLFHRWCSFVNRDFTSKFPKPHEILLRCMDLHAILRNHIRIILDTIASWIMQRLLLTIFQRRICSAWAFDHQNLMERVVFVLVKLVLLKLTSKIVPTTFVVATPSLFEISDV